MAVDAQKNTTWMGYPEPPDTDSIPRISAEEVAKLMEESGSGAGSSIQLVDVRRSDLTVSACSDRYLTGHSESVCFPDTLLLRPTSSQGYAIVGSLNLPAHTFYPSRATIAALLASTGTIILYCNSSMGRGPRCAGWLRDAFTLSTSTAPTPSTQAKVKILQGGVKGFVARYKDEGALVYKLPEEVKDA